MFSAGLPRQDTVLPSSRITIKCMQLLFKRLDSERLVHMLEEQGVWALLESGATFLQGAGLLARWAPRLPCGRRRQDLQSDGGMPCFWGIVLTCVPHFGMQGKGNLSFQTLKPQGRKCEVRGRWSLAKATQGF